MTGKKVVDKGRLWTNRNPIYCLYCRKELAEDPNLCPHCGQSQIAAPAPEAPAPIYDPEKAKLGALASFERKSFEQKERRAQIERERTGMSLTNFASQRALYDDEGTGKFFESKLFRGFAIVVALLFVGAALLAIFKH